MRLIMMVALATGLATGQFEVEATAAGLPQPQQQTAQTGCGTTSAAGSPGDPDQHMAGPGCRAASLGGRLAERRPGFWTADDAAPAPGQVASEASPVILRAALSQASPEGAPCTSYPLMVVVSGEPREATVVACPQPDGGWQVTQSTPGLPTQSFTVPPEPSASSSPDDLGTGGDFANWGSAPAWDWAAQPWFYGFAPALVVQEFNRFHHFGDEFGRHEFGRHEFGRGEFGRGEFGRGFSRGFTRGVAVGNRVVIGRNFAVWRGFAAGRGFVAGRR